MFSENCGPISCRPTGAPRETARNVQAGQAGHVRRDGEQVGAYIASGSAVFSPSGNATVGDVGETSTSNRSSAAACSRQDHRPHLLRLAVVGVVVAGRERVGAEHDPPLRLVAEALVARPLDHLAESRRRHAQPVTDAVVAGQVGGRFSGRDQVVARQPVLDRARQLALPHLGTELARELDRVCTDAATPGSIPSASFSSFGTPIRRPCRLSAWGGSGVRSLRPGAVPRVECRPARVAGASGSELCQPGSGPAVEATRVPARRP